MKEDAKRWISYVLEVEFALRISNSRVGCARKSSRRNCRASESVVIPRRSHIHMLGLTSADMTGSLATNGFDRTAKTAPCRPLNACLRLTKMKY